MWQHQEALGPTRKDMGSSIGIPLDSLEPWALAREAD
jgi:hypothetical protein